LCMARFIYELWVWYRAFSASQSEQDQTMNSERSRENCRGSRDTFFPLLARCMGGGEQVTGRKKLWQMQHIDIKMVTRGTRNGLSWLLVGSERALRKRDCSGQAYFRGLVFEVRVRNDQKRRNRGFRC